MSFCKYIVYVVELGWLMAASSNRRVGKLATTGVGNCEVCGWKK